MDKKKIKREEYKPPICKVIELEDEGFFCTSVRGNFQSSTQEPWNNEEEIDEGDMDFGY